ncbi:MAG: hypothetical protein ACD_22C00083G0009 [uncultured bacterium]|nr:MAG: hypothetical protein ACD_22C00083G0009 [uncultured bacterium]
MTSAIRAKKKIVVIGGGTGTSVVLSGLKKVYVDLTAIISMADSGGSTGRLRDQFGFLPVGDLRQSLAALARENDQSWIRDLLLYRFQQGEGLKGHNLGNLILTALQDLSGSTPKALDIAGKVFRLEGNILPVTTDKVDLVIEYTDGSFVIGENNLNPCEEGGKAIKRVRLSPQAKLNPQAEKALCEADMIVAGPGDLYASILPNFVVKGMKKAMQETKAKIVYIENLMTRHTQTHGYTAKKHVDVVRKYMGRYPHVVIVNSEMIPDEVLKAYEEEKGYPVINDLKSQKDYKIIDGKFYSIALTKANGADSIKRSLLVHDKVKLTECLLELLPKV